MQKFVQNCRGYRLGRTAFRVVQLRPAKLCVANLFGACTDCHGLGTRMIVDPELIVPDPGKSLSQGAISPWASAHVADYVRRLAGELVPA